MIKIILIAWAAFDLLVYLYMWHDRKDHHYNFKEKFQDIRDSFEQDE